MSELDNKPYGVSFIASAPEELKVGDRVEIVKNTQSRYEGNVGTITLILDDGLYRVGFGGYSDDYPWQCLRKLPDTISFEERFGINPSTVASANKIVSHAERYSDNVKAFKAILNEMAETYKAKDADYGSAYDDGYRLFGHTQLLSRFYEKFSRVKHLLDGNKPNVAENICDTLTDMSIQCIALRMLLQKNDFENVV